MLVTCVCAPAGAESPVDATHVDQRRVEPSSNTLRLAGLLQVDWVIHRQSSQDELDPASAEPLNQDRLLLRRGRVALEAQHGWVGGRLELDANTLSGLEVRPFEALIFARYPRDGALEKRDLAAAAPELAAAVSVGLRRIPFGFETSEPEAARPWLERSLGSRAFFGQARDFGIGVDASYRVLSVSVALMNGEPLSDDEYAGRDLTGSKDWVARSGVLVALVPAVRVRFGVSWLSGTGLHRGTPATKDNLVWVDGNEDGLIAVTELTSVPGAPLTRSRSFARAALGVDAGISFQVPTLGALSLRAELVRAVNLDRTLVPADPVARGRDLRELGVFIGAAQQVTRYAELALRYERYDPDADASRQAAAAVVPSDSSYATLAVALAGKLGGDRLILEYDYNDNALGRSASGAPTRLRDDALTLRAEAHFR